MNDTATVRFDDGFTLAVPRALLTKVATLACTLAAAGVDAAVVSFGGAANKGGRIYDIGAMYTDGCLSVDLYASAGQNEEYHVDFNELAMSIVGEGFARLIKS